MGKSIIASAVCALLSASPLHLQGTAFTYQGRLQEGGVAADGLLDFRFRLFDAAAGGTQHGSTVCWCDVDAAEASFTGRLDFGPQLGTPRGNVVFVDNRGRVAIGTTAPAAKLDVRDDIRLSSSSQCRATSGEERTCGSSAAL